MAYAAIVARRASLVHAREHRRTPDGHDAIIVMFRERISHILLHAGHFHRRQKLSVRKLRQALWLTADSRELFHVVVPRRDVRITERPIDSNSLFRVGFKIQIAPAITLTAPNDGLPAHLPPTNPREMLAFRTGIWIFHVIDEKLVRVFIARVVALALDVLRAFPLGSLVPAPVAQLPDRNVLHVVA